MRVHAYKRIPRQRRMTTCVHEYGDLAEWPMFNERLLLVRAIYHPRVCVNTNTLLDAGGVDTIGAHEDVVAAAVRDGREIDGKRTNDYEAPVQPNHHNAIVVTTGAVTNARYKSRDVSYWYHDDDVIENVTRIKYCRFIIIIRALRRIRFFFFFCRANEKKTIDDFVV